MASSEQVVEPKAGPRSAGPKLESALWESFSGAQDALEFARAWLGLQCAMISGATAGLLLLDDGDGHFSTAAIWPDPRRDLAHLTDAAKQTLIQRRSLIHHPMSQPAGTGTVHIGHPIEVGRRLRGVIVIEIQSSSNDVQHALRQLQWGAGWLETMFRREQAEDDAAKLARTSFSLEILAEFNEHPSLLASALAVVNDLSVRHSCRRVSLGLIEHGRIRLVAISHSAIFQEKAQLTTAIRNAMEEAGDQFASVTIPASGKTERRISLAHQDLMKISGATAVASVVMMSSGRPIGAITLERDTADAFSERSMEMLEALAVLLGPTFEIKAGADKLLAGRLVQGSNSAIKGLFGPGRPTFKIVSLLAASILVYLSFAQGDFRVAAKAVVEGAVQRAAVAPFDGFIARALVRAGDIVEEGQLLATLDDRELALEAARWKGEQEQQALKYSDAMAKRDRSGALILSASIEQTQAQLSLVEDKLARSRITAPFRGVVVAGDLSQSIGSPIEKGKTLFEIAPLETFRVILQVDERDIGYVAQGQEGNLLLTSLAADSFSFNVKKVTPVATAADGRNHFRVEADVRASAIQLRPGMEGIGKVFVDRRSLIAIWTRPLIEWLRMTLWKWSP